MRLFITAAVFLLSSCSSQPQTTYYQLPLSEVAASVSSHNHRQATGAYYQMIVTRLASQ